jgi:N-acyl-L-homoserine lactone synthetase
MGFVGAFTRFGEYIGTIRYLPMNRGLAPCDKLVRQHAIPESLLDESWEVGRLVLDPQYRSGFDSLKRLLFLSLVDILDHHPIDNLFASCTPVLSRLYRRFGFSVLVKDASQDAEGSYSLIHGHVPEVLRALAATVEERAQVERFLALRHAGEALPC